jgi:hypothetical protein
MAGDSTENDLTDSQMLRIALSAGRPCRDSLDSVFPGKHTTVFAASEPGERGMVVLHIAMPEADTEQATNPPPYGPNIRWLPLRDAEPPSANCIRLIGNPSGRVSQNFVKSFSAGGQYSTTILYILLGALCRSPSLQGQHLAALAPLNQEVTPSSSSLWVQQSTIHGQIVCI